MTARDAALDEIAALAARHDLTLDEIGARMNVRPAPTEDGRQLTQMFGYLGAVLIFGGLGLFINMEWDRLNSAARVIITYGPGLASFILGVITMGDARYRKASAPLFVASAALQPTGMFVFLHEYTHGHDAQLAALFVFGLSAIQFLGGFFQLRRTTLLFFGYLFWNAAVGILMDRSGVPGDTLGIGLGLSILATAWALDRTPHRGIAGFWYLLGGAGLLWSLFDAVQHTPFDVLYIAVASFMMFVSVRMRSRTLLFVSTGALLAFFGYYTEEHFAHVVGWPITLIVMGMMLVGISAFAVRLGRGITAPPAAGSAQ